MDLIDLLIVAVEYLIMGMALAAGEALWQRLSSTSQPGTATIDLSSLEAVDEEDEEDERQRKRKRKRKAVA